MYIKLNKLLTCKLVNYFILLLCILLTEINNFNDTNSQRVKIHTNTKIRHEEINSKNTLNQTGPGQFCKWKIYCVQYKIMDFFV